MRSPSSSSGAGLSSSCSSGLPDHVAGRPAEDPLGSRVHVRDVVLLVHGHDRVRSRGSDRAEVLLAQAQLLLGVLATDQGAHLGGHRGHERNQALVLLALLEHEELDHGHDLVLRHDGHGDAAGQPDRLREQAALEAAGRSARRGSRPRRALSHALPGRPIPGTNDSASVTRRNEDRPAVAACQAGLHTSVRPSGLSTHAWPIAQPVRSHTPAQHHLERTLGGVRPGDRQRQVVRQRELVLRAAAVGDVAADAVDQLEAGVRPRAELEPAIGAVDRSQPRLEGGHAAGRDHTLERVRRGRHVIRVQQLLIGVPGERLRVEAEHRLVRRVGPPHPRRRTRSRRAGRRRSRAAAPGRARREAPPSRPQRLRRRRAAQPPPLRRRLRNCDYLGCRRMPGATPRSRQVIDRAARLLKFLGPVPHQRLPWSRRATAVRVAST